MLKGNKLKLTVAQKLLLKNAAENERRKALALMLREEYRQFIVRMKKMPEIRFYSEDRLTINANTLDLEIGE